MSSPSDLPIDIHYNKLLDWLISRRHCQQQWQRDALVIRERINNAIQDMPPVEEITSLLHGTYINYFHCLKIVELLKETESGSKNIFGRYSSQRMKDWLEIVKSYEKDGIGLAEAAQLLMRNVNYEIPSLKKQIAKCKQTQQDCERKEGEYASNSAELLEKYRQSCKQLGIEGKKVKTELLGLVKDLPEVYDRIGANTANLRPATEYYTQFVKFTLNSDVGEGCVPLLRYLQQHGNTTCYQYRTGSPPLKVEPPQLDLSAEDEDTPADAAAEIDWGALDSEGIDFGSSGDVIDFGESEEPGGVDWGDQQVDIEVVADCGDIIIESEKGIAKGTDALSILDNVETRSQVLNQLLELEAFLKQRQVELSDTSDVLTSSLFQNAPASLHVTMDTVQGMLGQVQDILVQLNSPKMQDLMMIRSSPRYVNRLADKLRKLQENSEKAMSLSRLMVTRSKESREEEVTINPRLDLIREKTMQLKLQIEGEISKKYQNRRVNIMGEINTV